MPFGVSALFSDLVIRNVLYYNKRNGHQKRILLRAGERQE